MDYSHAQEIPLLKIVNIGAVLYVKPNILNDGMKGSHVGIQSIVLELNHILTQKEKDPHVK